MIIAPLAMLVAVRPLLSELADRAARPPLRLGWAVLALAFVGGGVYSSFLALRDAPVGPPGHGGELQAFLPIVHGKPVLYAGQDRYAAYELLGADTHVPLVEFPDEAVVAEPGKAVRHRRRLQPDRLRLLLAAARSTLPLRGHQPRRPGTARRRRTSSESRRPPPTCSGSGPGRRREDRHVLLEGTEAGAHADCDSPEIRILLANRRHGLALPRHRARRQRSTGATAACSATAQQTAQTLDLPAGSLEPLAPVLLALRADAQRARLQRTAEGGTRRPAAEHDQPRQQRPVLARRALREQGRHRRLHADRGRRQRPAEPDRLRRQGLHRRAGRGSGRTAPHRAAAQRPATAGSTGTDSSALP